MRLALAAVLLVGLLPLVAANEATLGLTDAEGDGGEGDVVRVIGALDDGGFVQVLFAGGLDLEGLAIRGVLVSGGPGSPEPSEWYQFTMANVTHVFAAHGTPRDVRVVSSSWNGSIATLRFERSEPAGPGCTFAVVETGRMGEGGFEVLDVAPSGFASMDAAWPVDACPDAQQAPGTDEPEAEKGSPGLGLGLLVAVGVAALVRRS